VEERLGRSVRAFPAPGLNEVLATDLLLRQSAMQSLFAQDLSRSLRRATGGLGAPEAEARAAPASAKHANQSA